MKLKGCLIAIVAGVLIILLGLVVLRASIMRGEIYSHGFAVATADPRVTDVTGTPVSQAQWMPDWTRAPADYPFGSFTVAIEGPHGRGTLHMEWEGDGFRILEFRPLNGKVVGLDDLIADRKPSRDVEF